MSEHGTITGAVSRKISNVGIVSAFLVVIIHCRPHFRCGTPGWWLAEILENGVTQIAVPFFFAVSLAIAELLKRTMPKTSAVLFGGR